MIDQKAYKPGSKVCRTLVTESLARSLNIGYHLLQHIVFFAVDAAYHSSLFTFLFYQRHFYSLVHIRSFTCRVTRHIFFFDLLNFTVLVRHYLCRQLHFKVSLVTSASFIFGLTNIHFLPTLQDI